MIRRFLGAIGLLPRSSPDALAPGDLASVATDEGPFGVMKVLVVDRGGVHVRLHVQRFTRRPTAAELGELTVVPFGPSHDTPWSAYHLPLSRATVAGWQPEVIVRELGIHDDELEGYRMWREARGGYF
jgi:hypothetical protein